MSGECDDCGEHTLDCRCNGRNRDADETRVSTVFLRDEIDRCVGLLRCLFLLMEHAHSETSAYTSPPHHDLYLALEEKLTGIEKALRRI